MEELKEVRKDMKDLKCKMIGKIREKVCDEVKDNMTGSYRDVVREEAQRFCQSHKSSSNSSEIVEEAVGQVQDRMCRENNIIHGIPEPSIGELNTENREEVIFKKFCSKFGLNCYNSDVEQVRRTDNMRGEETQDNNWAKIMTVKGGLKMKIMKNLYKLRNAKEPAFRKVGVYHDMTKEELEKDKKLRNMAREKNEEEKNSGIFYVVRGKPWKRYFWRVDRRREENM